MSKRGILLILILVLAFFPSLPRASAVLSTSIEPVEDGYIEYDTVATYTRANNTNYLSFHYSSTVPRIRRSYIEWDISSIPDGAIITKVALKYHGAQHAADGHIRQMELRPSISSDQDVYTDAGNGTTYADPAGFPVVGTDQEVVLGDDPSDPACQDLQNQLSQDWFAIGIRVDDEAASTAEDLIYSSEYGSATPKPTLYVEYLIDPATYTFHGLYYENGTAAGAVNVTAYFPSNATDTFQVNGSKTVYYEEQPLLFTFPVSSDIRRIYVTEHNDTFYLFTPESSYTTYEFTIKDYTGVIGEGDSYLEALRYVNSTERLIERMKIQDTITSVPLILVVNRVYVLQVRLSDGSTYRFGYYVSGVDPTPTLSIRTISFSQAAQVTYRYVTVEATRSSDATTITVNYQDNLDQTILVDLEIRYQNGTVAYSDNSTANPTSFVWNSAVNTTDYYAVVTITHGFFGTLTYVKPLGKQISVMAAPSAGVFGSWGLMSPGSVIPAAIIFVVAGAFSAFSVPFALFAVVVTAGIFVYLGWVSISTTLLAEAMAMAVIIGIVRASRRRGR